MGGRAIRGYIMLLGAVRTAAPPDDCPPYTKRHHLACDINLPTLRVPLPNTAVVINVCEKFT